MPESWEQYGFPNPYFQLGYLPLVGLYKAMRERAKAFNYLPYVSPVPDYFVSVNDSFLSNLDSSLYTLLYYKFVNPDKIPGASFESKCYWTWDDLSLAAAGGVKADIFPMFYYTDPLITQFPVKWAVQRYKAINLLRYVRTKSLPEWPFMEYKDLNDTFDFKAP